MLKGYKIVVFCNSIFDEGQRGPIRKIKFEIQQYGISFQKCRYCGGVEVRERHFIPEEFLNEKAFIKIDLIQLTYPSSPRGAHRIIVNNDDYYNYGRNSNLPNTYNGWGGAPSNIYIPIKGIHIEMEEKRKIQIIAIRENEEQRNLKEYIGTISAGNSGYWNLYINKQFERKEIEPELIGHSSCVKQLRFSELDQENLIKGIRRGYFREMGRNTYVSVDGEEVWHKGGIYHPYKTDKGDIVLLSTLPGDFTGIDKDHEEIYYDRDQNDRVRIYYNENFERGVNFDYAERGVIDINDEELSE